MGAPHWRICFAPADTGNGQYMIRVTDVSVKPKPQIRRIGISNASVPPTAGSAAPHRPIPGISSYPMVRRFRPGVKHAFDSTYEADSLLQTYGESGVKIARWWMDFREWQNPFGGGATIQRDFSLSLSNTVGPKQGDRDRGMLSAGANTHQSVTSPLGALYRLTGYVK